jgi:alanine racemase
VGYGGTWQAERPSTIATIAVGYADGFPRSPPVGISEAVRRVELRGRLVPVVGRVTMDMCMAAVDDDVQVGDVATIYGGQVSLDQQAEMAGTISYELLTRLGARVPRRYQGLG